MSLDVAVVGNGAAALMAALHARRADVRLRVGMLFGSPTGQSGCSINAQGLNAAIGVDDSPALHFEDVVRAGRFVADQALAWTVAAGAPDELELIAAGAALNRDPDGEPTRTAYEGQSRRRRLQSAQGIGLQLVRHLGALVEREGVIQLPGIVGVELLADDNAEIGGILAIEPATGATVTVSARAIVLATGGGAASLYPLATAPATKTCDGLAMAYRAGLELRDLEFVQFLPMGMRPRDGGPPGAAIREGVRFAGAHLLNARGERYMARYHNDQERGPRDVVARATYAEIAVAGDPDGAVWLDVAPIGQEILEARFRDVIAHAASAGFDIVRERIPVAPTAHVGIGGVVVDIDGRTSREGVLAAGEDAGGTHGASWQPGNGLAEAVVLGARTGRAAAAMAADRRPCSVGSGRATPPPIAVPADRPEAGTTDAEVLLRDLRGVMFDRVGLVRSEEGLAAAAASIEALAERAATAEVGVLPAPGAPSASAIGIRNQLAVASLVVAAARARTESRGVHSRSDYPDEDPRWLSTIVLRAPVSASGWIGEPDVVVRAAELTRLQP